MQWLARQHDLFLAGKEHFSYTWQPGAHDSSAVEEGEVAVSSMEEGEVAVSAMEEGEAGLEQNNAAGDTEEDSTDNLVNCSTVHSIYLAIYEH